MLFPSAALIQARVVVLGDSTVGKTSLLNWIISRHFNQYEQPTVVSNFHIYTGDVKGTGIELQIWDTAGQEKFHSLGPIYYRNSLAALAVYDCTSRPSFEHLSQWIEDFIETAGRQTAIAGAGNKIDLTDRIDVTWPETMEWARAHGYLIGQTSAKTGQGVDVLFNELVQEIIRMQTSTRLSRLHITETQVGGGVTDDRKKKCKC
jgi:small GTP-binding protein